MAQRDRRLRAKPRAVGRQPRDTTGHGTHGLSVAAGDDPATPGLAPAADLVVVKATREDGTLGFESADVVNAHFGTGYKWTETTKHRKYQDVIAAIFTSYDLDGNRQNAGIWTQGSTEFQNNHSWNYRLAYFPGSMSSRPRLHRGPRRR